MNNKRYTSILAVFLIMWSIPALSATWQVELDGSGDFTQIQDAVDAAVAGDTILIGPGRFDTFVEVVAPAWTEPTIVWVTKDNLTFIGAGPGQTILGPTEYYDPIGEEPKGIICIDDYHGVVKDLTIENLRTGYWWTYGSFEMVNCSIENCHGGIISTNSGGAQISDSHFSNFFIDMGYGIGSWGPAQNLFVTNCSFDGGGGGQGIILNSVENAIVDSCFFQNSGAGITAAGSTTTQVFNCETGQGIATGVWATGGTVDLQSNSIFGSYEALSISSGGTVTGTNNIFQGGNHFRGTINVGGSWATVSLQGNHIFRNNNQAVITHDFILSWVYLDLTNNYWGSTDPEEIAEWIWDGTDDSSIHATVNFLPIADGPVSSEKKSFGGVKALYR